MAVSSSSNEETLIVERKEEMVSPLGGKPSLRIAHFLNTPSKPLKYPQTLLNPTKPRTQKFKSLPSKLNFHAWKCPMKNWVTWIEKLRPKYEQIWKKASIFEPIMASTLEIPRCYDSLFALAMRWNPETNSFVFPWGEATVTLEDVMVLGGYSVTGDSVLSKHQSKHLCDIVDKMNAVRLEIMRTKAAKKATYHLWMSHWMDNGSEFEHEGFLALWLSRCVLPADSSDTVNKMVFPIAVLLSGGTEIALAPAVLASIYKDLRLLKEKIASFVDHDGGNGGNVAKLNLVAPLQLLQAWFWERFPMLSPIASRMISELPRLARWHKVKIVKNDDLGSDVDSAKEGFRWRPYSTPLNNWPFRVKFYPEEAVWVSIGCGVDLDLESYVKCIRGSELVGLDCIEQYLPHRVSMQFGLDQDIPVGVPRLDGFSDHKIAWSHYNTTIRDVKLYMPSRLFESDVTTRYSRWWKELRFVEGKTSSVTKKEGVRPGGSHSQGIPNGFMDSEERLRIKKEQNEAYIPPGFSPKHKRVVVNVPSEEPSSKSSKGLTESNKVGATPSPPQVEETETDDDSDYDQLPLTEFLRLDHTKRANKNAAFPSSQSEVPLSSARDDVPPRETTSLKKHPVEVGTNGKLRSLIRNSTVKIKDVGISTNGAPECAKMDLIDRIVRLQRIVDVIKLAKSSQT